MDVQYCIRRSRDARTLGPGERLKKHGRSLSKKDWDCMDAKQALEFLSREIMKLGRRMNSLWKY